MTKEQFIDKWENEYDSLGEDLEAVIANEIAKVQEPQPELNPIEQAYERGEKIRAKFWKKGTWAIKNSDTHAVDEKKVLWDVQMWDFKTKPEKWELYTEPTEQPAPPMTYQEAVNLIISRKLTHKLAGNDSWFACGYCGKIIQFCDESGNDMIEVRFDELELTEWYPYKKPFDKDRFERMFCAVVALEPHWTYKKCMIETEKALAQLDAYYASKEGGCNNG